MAPLEKQHETMSAGGPANPLSETSNTKNSHSLASNETETETETKKADGDSGKGASFSFLITLLSCINCCVVLCCIIISR